MNFFHNMQNYVHYLIHFVIMLIFFFHQLPFTVYYFHRRYYCLIVFMSVFFCEIYDIFAKSQKNYSFNCIYYVFVYWIYNYFFLCSFILLCATFTIIMSYWLSAKNSIISSIVFKQSSSCFIDFSILLEVVLQVECLKLSQSPI